MKRFLTETLKFLLFTSVFLFVGIIIWGTFLPLQIQHNLRYQRGGHSFTLKRINELKNHQKNIDILVLGSSHANRGFDPRIFKEYNINLFNLGTSAQTPIQTRILVRRFLEDINPNIVILEVFPNVFRADGAESATDIVSHCHIDKEMVDMALEINNLKVYLTLFYAYFRQIFSLNDPSEVTVSRSDGAKYISGGYLEHIKKTHRKGIVHKKTKLNIRSYQKKAFTDTINYLKKRNKKIVLVQMPITEELYSSYKNVDKINSWLESFGVPFYNMNNLVELSSEKHFYDAHHLNQDGVEKTNKILIEILKEDEVVSR